MRVLVGGERADTGHPLIELPLGPEFDAAARVDIGAVDLQPIVEVRSGADTGVAASGDDGAAIEVAQAGVTVNCISPGYVWTTLVENQIPDTMKARGLTREQVMNDVLLAAQPTKKFVTVDQVAAFTLFLCRDEAAAITGANLSMDGGWTAQ